MPVPFGFSASDFVAAVALCAKIAKAIQASGGAATEYQQVVIELQGLQNVLIRLAGFEPTESNIQHVNAIRAAALASTFSLKDVLSDLEKFERSMSSSAARKPLSIGGATRRAQYALSMADEVKKIRAVIYGNVIRINVLLGIHASESLSRIEDRLVTQNQDLRESFDVIKKDMAQALCDIKDSKIEATASREEGRLRLMHCESQIQELSSTTEASTATLTERLLGLSRGVISVSTSVASVWDLSSQILALLRAIPAELSGLIQSVVRSNAKIEATLMNIDQRIAPSPSLVNGTNIRLEDALGRVHSIPFEWFQDYEIFEGFLKARFRDVPGRQKIESGDFRLVHSKRSSVYIDGNSWAKTIKPGAQLVMLMVLANVAFRDSSCPRRSCAGKIMTKAGSTGLVTCPDCNVQFVPQMASVIDTSADTITRLQRIEDAQLFGETAMGPEVEIPDSSSLARQIADGTENIQLVSARTKSSTGQGGWTPHVGTILDVSGEQGVDQQASFQTSSPPASAEKPPIMSWLSQTIPPKNPESVRQWYDDVEREQQELKDCEMKDIEVFRNVQITGSANVGAPNSNSTSTANLAEDEVDLCARIYYRNILDRYPRIDRSLARRLAAGNWRRQIRLATREREERELLLPPTSLNSRRQENGESDNIRKRRGLGPLKISREGLIKPNHSEKLDRSARKHVDEALRHSHDYPSTRHHDICFQDSIRRIPSPEKMHADELAKEYRIDILRLLSRSERKVCKLLPLPMPINKNRTGVGTTRCYLCHLLVEIRSKKGWR